MDNNNVIIPTNDLNQLELDMDSWNRLPYKLKKLSIDACMRQYNCTVYDLYNRLKGHILDMQARNEQEPDNLVVINTESADDEGFYDYSKFGEPSDFENYYKLLQISDMLTRADANIVIINPDDTLDEVEAKFNSYMHLIQKFKTFSNDYSIQLWGYNVPNMYERMKAKISTDMSTTDNDNIINYNAEAHIVDTNKKILKEAKCLGESEDMEISIPNVVPWFTVTEMYKRDIQFSYIDPNSYVKAVKEADNATQLNLGWNPSVMPNERAFEVAADRQRNYFYINPIIVNDIRDKDFVNSEDPVIYLYIENPLPDNDTILTKPEEFDKPHYTRFGVEVNGRTYMVNENGTFYERPIDFLNLEIIAIPVNTIVYENIANNINGFDTNLNDAGNLYYYLFKRTTPLDRTKEKLIYAYILNKLYTIGGVDKKELGNPNFAPYYRVFRGSREELDLDKVKNIIKLINDNR